MTKIVKLIGILLSLPILFWLVFEFFMNWSYIPKMTEYYSNESNYITCDVIVEDIILNDKEVYLIISCENIDDIKYKTTVYIPLNYDILKEYGFFDDVAIGDEIEITIAPKIWGDGYKPPISGITVENIVYLDFDLGKTLTLEYVKK